MWWYVLLVVGQGVTMALGWVLARRLIERIEKASVILALVFQQLNELHPDPLTIRRPPPAPEPPDEPPTLFIG